MKLTLFSVLNLVVVVLAVKQPQKSVIVSYPNDTPDSVVQQAMGAIKDAGGMITHEYKLIKCIGLIIFAGLANIFTEDLRQRHQRRFSKLFKPWEMITTL